MKILFCVGSEKYFSAIFGCSINKFEHNREKIVCHSRTLQSGIQSFLNS